MKKRLFGWILFFFLLIGVCYGYTIYTGNRKYVGNVEVDGTIVLPKGSASVPSLNLGGSAATLGFYTDPDNSLIWMTSGTGRIRFAITSADASLYFNATNPSITLNDTSFIRDGSANVLQFGSDAATASDFTIAGPDSTGDSQTGGDLVIEGGAGGSGGVEGEIQFSSIARMSQPDAAAVAPTRATKFFSHTRSLAADANDACGGTDDCLTLPIPTTAGYLRLIGGSADYMDAVVANDGTSTTIDTPSANMEYKAAIAECTKVCLHDGGANAIIFNDTASAVVVTVLFWYD